MQAGELKPVLTALALPPTSLLLLALLGVAIAARRRAGGLLLVLAALAGTYLLSTNGLALLLAPHLMPGVAPADTKDLQRAQAIVVLGGGVVPAAPEYGVAQPSPNTLQRLRYGVHLARQGGQPLAFTGGVGWGAAGLATEAEGAVARRVLAEYGLAARWIDDQARDTGENALRMAQMLHPEGLRRIALVTDAVHMPRAAAAFRAAGFEVLPAPTDFPVPRSGPLLEWLPSAHGASINRQMLREWMGRGVARLRS